MANRDYKSLEIGIIDVIDNIEDRLKKQFEIEAKHEEDLIQLKKDLEIEYLSYRKENEYKQLKAYNDEYANTIRNRYANETQVKLDEISRQREEEINKYEEQLRAIKNLDEKARAEKQKELDEQHKKELARIAELEKETEKNDIERIKRVAKKDAEIAKELEKEKEKNKDRREREQNAKKKKELREEKNSAKTDASKRYKEEKEELGKALFGKGVSLKDRFNTLGDAFTSDVDTGNKGANAANGLMKGLSTLAGALADFTKQLDESIKNIADSQQKIDTRLQGSTKSWHDMSNTLKENLAASPYVKQEDVVNNLKTMISKGIAYNVEQRAFLETVKVGIADTFDANNSTLARLIRIQQQDSTAARLGMESAMTAFLNNMYETSEYMSDIMQSMKDQLGEAEALMDLEAATSFEYQVQKWLGSMYSVGMSNGSVSSIGSALGKLAAGQVEGITGGNTGVLLAVAAGNSGVSLADALKDGLDESSTNRLMKSMVEYLSGIYNQTKGNKVVQQQFANVFGLTASDLKAIANMSQDVNNVYNSTLSYENALGQLDSMANSYGSRMSLGQKLENATGNFKYTLAQGIANSPALYTTYMVANMLDSVAGGLEFSLPLVMGTGSAQTFNTADIMKATALSGSLLGGLGSIVGSLGGSISSGLSSAMSAFGVGSGNKVSRGNGQYITRGAGTSESGYAGNAGGDVYEQTMTSVTDEQNQKVVEAKNKQDEDEITIKTVNTNLVEIANLLKEVVNGSSSLNVRLDSSETWTKTLNTFAGF